MRSHLVLSIKFKFVFWWEHKKMEMLLCVFKLSGAMVLCTLKLPMWFMRPNKIADVKDIFYRISQDMKNIFCLQITWNFFSHGQDFVRTLNQTVGGSKIQIYYENIKLLWCSYYFGWLIFEKGLNPWGGSTVQDKIPKKIISDQKQYPRPM